MNIWHLGAWRNTYFAVSSLSIIMILICGMFVIIGILAVKGVCATLTWSRRMKIALDAAKGLAFLHDAERPIIYRDFKTSNILLDAVSHSASFC